MITASPKRLRDEAPGSALELLYPFSLAADGNEVHKMVQRGPNSNEKVTDPRLCYTSVTFNSTRTFEQVLA